MSKKDGEKEFYSLFSRLNKTNRQYLLAILRSLHFAEEQAKTARKDGETGEKPERREKGEEE